MINNKNARSHRCAMLDLMSSVIDTNRYGIDRKVNALRVVYPNLFWSWESMDMPHIDLIERRSGVGISASATTRNIKDFYFFLRNLYKKYNLI